MDIRLDEKIKNSVHKLENNIQTRKDDTDILFSKDMN